MLSRHLTLSATQLTALMMSLLSQLMMARHVGPGRALDLYFATTGFAAAAVGGIVVASTYLVPAHVRSALDRSASPGDGADAARDCLLAMLSCGALLSVLAIVAYGVVGIPHANGASASWWLLLICSWLAALLSIAVAGASGIGAAHGVVALPMVLGMLPPGLIVAYLALAGTPDVGELALAQSSGVAIQAIGLGVLLRGRWHVRHPHWPSIRSLIKLVPLAALGAVCFSGYAAVDALLAPRIGEGVLSHQAMAQRLVIAFGSVASAGPFMLAPSRMATLLTAGDRDAAWSYGLRAVLGLTAVMAFAAAMTQPVGRWLIKLLFEHGTFGSRDTVAVSQIVQILLLGAGPMLGTAVLFRILHGLHRPKYVAAASLAFLAAYGACAALLAEPLGPDALATAYSLAWVGTLILTLGLVRVSLRSL